MIGLNLRACIVAISILFGMTAAISAQTLDQAWIQLEAHPDLTASEEGARFYAQLGENVAGFRLESGWYVVALGPFNRQDAQARLSIL